VKIAFVLVLGVLALLPAAHAAPNRVARVVITDTAPFTVVGSGFAANEHVKVTVQAKQRTVRWIFAAARGTFTARFPTVTLEHCNSYLVRAVGSKGSVAVRKVTPECAAPGPDDPMYPIDPTPKKR
jgi:hypothetical protein